MSLRNLIANLPEVRSPIEKKVSFNVKLKWTLIILIAFLFSAFLVFVINRIVTAHKRQATTGREDLLGKTAVVRTSLEPEGRVIYEGEIWTATLDKGRAEPKEEVIIQNFDGLKLYVTKKNKGGS